MNIGTMSGKGSDSSMRRETPHLKYRSDLFGCWCIRPSGKICTHACLFDSYADGAGKESVPFVEYVRDPEENGSSASNGVNSEIVEGRVEGAAEYVLGNGGEDSNRMD
jgi:hypothetical protein